VHVTARNLTAKDKVFLNTFDFSHLIRAIEQSNSIDANCAIEISAGEITINPRRDEILEAVKDYPVLLFSNCVIYDERVLQIIRKSDSFLLESLDAGTRETYAKIKGKDVFCAVLENIRRYAVNGGHIHLKYIVTLENSNEDDLKGFLDLCDEVKPQMIRISRDIHNDFRQLPQPIIDFAIKLGRGAVERGHEVMVLEYFGSNNDAEIRHQIFKS
jgi:MoaA/NifB/PqqE/SkfB family radical SAM enzyme